MRERQLWQRAVSLCLAITVSSLSGRVELRSGDCTRDVAAGESASVGQSGGTPQGNGLSRGERWALGLGIGSVAIAILILAVGGGDDDPPPQFGDEPRNPIRRAGAAGQFGKSGRARRPWGPRALSSFGHCPHPSNRWAGGFTNRPVAAHLT
jgi:hypothetical protein